METIQWVRGVGTYAQTGRKWGDEDYLWDSVPLKKDKENSWAHLGCTLTSLTNILYWGVKGVNAPTPHDTNIRSEKFFNAFEKVYFKCLKTGKKFRFGGRGGTDTSLIYDGGTFDQRVDIDSPKYTDILNRTRSAIRIGHPVLLSYRNCKDGDGSFSHSVIAVGVSNEEHIYILEVYGEETAVTYKLKECVNITPCKTIYKAFECIRV